MAPTMVCCAFVRAARPRAVHAHHALVALPLPHAFTLLPIRLHYPTCRPATARCAPWTPYHTHTATATPHPPLPHSHPCHTFNFPFPHLHPHTLRATAATTRCIPAACRTTACLLYRCHRALPACPPSATLRDTTTPATRAYVYILHTRTRTGTLPSPRAYYAYVYALRTLHTFAPPSHCACRAHAPCAGCLCGCCSLRFGSALHYTTRRAIHTYATAAHLPRTVTYHTTAFLGSRTYTTCYGSPAVAAHTLRTRTTLYTVYHCLPS